MLWKPNVTVAAAIEHDGGFLLIEEQTGHGALYDQPAGHPRPDESPVTGIVREALTATDPRWPGNA